MPKVKLTKNTVCASEAAASASLAEASDEGDIGRHHRDLPELRQRHRHRELERFGQLKREMAAGRGSLLRKRRGFDSIQGGHFVRSAFSLVEMVAARLPGKEHGRRQERL